MPKYTERWIDEEVVSDLERALEALGDAYASVADLDHLIGKHKSTLNELEALINRLRKELCEFKDVYDFGGVCEEWGF